MPDEMGVFTTFVASPHQPVPYFADHYERLKRDTAFFSLPMPWPDLGAMQKEIDAYIAERMKEPMVMRISLTPKLTLNLRPLPPQQSSVRLSIVQFDRPFPQHKHLSRNLDTHFLEQVQAQHADDFLRVSSAGYLTETAYCNIFFVLPDARLCTPCPQQAGCLPGIMRKAVLNQGLLIEEGCYTLGILSEAVGAFVTNAVRGIVPVSQIDNHMLDVNLIPSVIAREHLD